jgi:tetratricopeptide (TPR) repeat protein
MALVMLVVLEGCGRATPQELLVQAGEAEQTARMSIDTARVKAEVDREQVFAPALELYSEIIDDHADAPEAEIALIRRAAILGNDTRQIEGAIEDYKTYAQRYPDGKNAPMAMFLVGYLYNNELHQIDSAGAAYRRFLDRYPDSEMASSAQFELKTLGKSPEELIPAEPPVETAGKGKKPAGRAM